MGALRGRESSEAAGRRRAETSGSAGGRAGGRRLGAVCERLAVGLGSRELWSRLGLLCPARGSPSCCQLWPGGRRALHAGEMLLCSRCCLVPRQEFCASLLRTGHEHRELLVPLWRGDAGVKEFLTLLLSQTAHVGKGNLYQQSEERGEKEDDLKETV